MTVPASPCGQAEHWRVGGGVARGSVPRNVAYVLCRAERVTATNAGGCLRARVLDPCGTKGGGVWAGGTSENVHDDRHSLCVVNGGAKEGRTEALPPSGFTPS